MIIINDEDRKELKDIAEAVNKPFKEIRELFSKKMTELKGLINSKGGIMLVKKELGVDVDTKKPEIRDKKIKEVKNMSVWDDIDLSTNEFNPFLKVKNKIIYHLKLVDPSKNPRPNIDGFGNNQYIWDVKLLDLEPSKAFEDADKEGKALFMKNKLYSFGMKKTCMRRFKELWSSVETVGKFSFKRIGSSFQTDYIFKEE